jgi:Zn-dependent protease with chaperone function
MYIPLCLFYDGTTSKGLMAETDIHHDGIYITYSTVEGEKKEINFNFSSIIRVIRRPNEKLLIVFGTSPQQMVEVRELPQVVAFLKMTGHRPEYSSQFDRLNTPRGKIFSIIGVLAILMLCLYFYIIPEAADVFARNLPVSYEVDLGNKIYNQIIANDTIDTLKTNLVNRFAKQIDFQSDFPIQIAVVHSHEINAFATPGGHIFIYDSLLNELENPDELAALLSHEATHIKERHSLRSISSDLSRSLFLSIIFHDRNGISSVIVNNANMLNSLRFSREMERVADEGAVKLMLNNNIDPDGMVQLLNLLKKEDKNHNTSPYLSTHPATDERIGDVKANIDNYDIRIIQNKQRNLTWKELNNRVVKTTKKKH